MGDTLYVADWGNKRVVALTTDLTFKFSFRKGADAMEPCGIAASDKELFVSDQAAHQLHVFSPTGEFLRSIGANGTQPGQFKSPCGVTCIGGILFVAEYVGRRVQALETDGTPLQVCSSSLGPSLGPLAPRWVLRLRCAAATPPRLPGAARGGRDLALRSLRRKATAPHRRLHALRDRRAAHSSPSGPPDLPLCHTPHTARPSSEGVHPCCRLRDRGAARVERRDGAADDCVRGEHCSRYSPFPNTLHIHIYTYLNARVCVEPCRSCRSGLR